MNLHDHLSNAGRSIYRHGKAILVVTTILTAVSLIGTFRLGIDTDIATMLPPDNPAARSFREISDAFETTSSLIVVIRGDYREDLIEAADKFTAHARADSETAPLIRSIQLKANRAFYEEWGLMMQDSEELADTEFILETPRLLPLLTRTNELIEEKLEEDSQDNSADEERATSDIMARLGLFSARLTSLVNGEEYDGTLADAWIFGEEYMIDPEETTLAMVVKPTFDLGDRARLTALSDGARKIATGISATVPVSFGFTGDVENEADEERAIGSDIFYPSICAIGMIVILFALSFKSKRSILFAVIALLIGIIIDLGFAAVTVGKLNMITSSFGALLVGLGIDFGIHLASRFDDGLQEGKEPETVIAEVFAYTGLPVAIGGLTTALAFYSLLFSRTLAFRQFGLIAGTGILTTLGAAFLVLPALLSVFSSRKTVTRGSLIPIHAFSVKLAAFSRKNRWPVLALALLATAGAIAAIPLNRFEYDMRRIGPQGTSAQETEGIVAKRFGISTWMHMYLAGSVEEARVVSAQFELAPLVSRVESIADYLPSAEEQDNRLAAITRIAEQARNYGSDQATDFRNGGVGQFTQELQRLEWNLIELGDLAAARFGEASLPVRKRNALIREIFGSETGAQGAEVFKTLLGTIESMPPEAAATRLALVDEAFSIDLASRIRKLTSTKRRITMADIPDDIRSDFVSPEGDRYLVAIQGDADLAGDQSFATFSAGLAEVSPNVTGSLVLGLELSREILVEAKSSAILVTAIVTILVLLSFRSFPAAALTMAAFLAGLAWTFGLYPFIGKFNIINALALPILIGIGIDYCVHVVTALRDPADPAGEFGKTAKAVTLSALTTLIGFGSLALIGKFKGIADLGATLSLGIFCSYLTAVVIIPACIAPAGIAPLASFHKQYSKEDRS